MSPRILRTPPHARWKRAWSEKELDQLRMLWGHCSLNHLVKTLNRSPNGICRKAQDLKLGRTIQDKATITGFAKTSGYTVPKIHKAARMLGIELRRAPRGDMKKDGNTTALRHFAISEADQEKILKFLLENPLLWEGAPGMKKSKEGMWGVGNKPCACLRCKRNSKPHRSRGYCAHCYNVIMGWKRRASTKEKESQKHKQERQQQEATKIAV